MDLYFIQNKKQKEMSDEEIKRFMASPATNTSFFHRLAFPGKNLRTTHNIINGHKGRDWRKEELQQLREVIDEFFGYVMSGGGKKRFGRTAP